MQKIFAATFCLSFLLPIPATADWFWNSGIGCEPLDQSCLLEVAMTDMAVMVEGTSINNYGKALGKLWPYLDAATSQKLVDTYYERHEGADLGRRVNIAIANTPPRSGALQQLTDLLDDPSSAGYLPANYLGPALTDAALREDPAATADLAIAKGEVFFQIATDGLYRVISWMARNDLTRLEDYLKAHDPQQAVYFSPSTHLFRVAAELCDAGQDGKTLADIALADFLQTPITITERYAVPMRAVVACDGLPAAKASLDELFLVVVKDIERQKARGRDGDFMVRRFVRAVNEDALTPVIRKLHEDDLTAEAETLAGRIFPEAQLIVSFDGSDILSIERSQVQARLAQILSVTDEASSHLDPVTMLKWFTGTFDPGSFHNAPDYAVFAIDPILRLWPAPLAQEAADLALHLLASSEFKIDDEIRLKTGIAIAQAATCHLPEAALEELLNQIGTLEKETPRVLAIADYMRYLDRYDEALPVC